MAITVKDANNVDRIFKTTLVGSEHTPHYHIDSLPALVASTANIGDVDVLTLPALITGTANIGHVGGTDYESVAASATNQVMGAGSGATGDYLSHVTITPTTVSPGAVSIKDGSNAAIVVFAGGTDSVATLHPFTVAIGAKSGQGAWQISTGANVTAIGVGDFT